MSDLPALRVSGVVESSLYVADLGRAESFYRRLFGFERLVGDDRFCALAVCAGQVLLLFHRGGSLKAIETPEGTIPPHDGDGQLHVAFAANADELDEWERCLAAEDIEVESRMQWPAGGESVFFRDPDGHLVELVTPGVWAVY